MFSNIGPMELAIVFVIALIVLGPKKLPEVGRSLGKGMREFKDSISGIEKDEEPRRELPPAEQPIGTQTTSAPAPPRERDSLS